MFKQQIHDFIYTISYIRKLYNLKVYYYDSRMIVSVIRLKKQPVLFGVMKHT